MMDDFIRGPMVWIAFALFFAGLAFQVFRFFSLTQKKEPLLLPKKKPPLPGKKKKAKKPLIHRIIALADRLYTTGYAKIRTSIAATHTVMTFVTVVFHFLLFLVPIFLLAHNQLIHRAWGLSLPSFSDSFADALTILFLLCAFFLLFRRIFVRRVRAISGLYDLLMWLITVVPFLTGFAAYHQWFDYPTILNVHIITGEVMLIVIPFTKLGHMLFFFFYRFLIGTEYSFGQGKRAW
jgi:nitrate reductase gamma subunit